MAEMSVRMTLTFNDLGTPGLKALQALIDSIGPKVTGLSQRFNTLERSIEKVGTAAQNTTARLGAYDAAIGRTAAATDNAAQSTNRFDAAIAALSAGLRSMTAVMSNLINSYNQLGTAANNVAGQMNAATASLAGANAQLSQMQGRVHGITEALAGMAQMWAAQKLFKAGGAAVKEAAEFELVEARLKALNLSQAENNELLRKSEEISKSMRFLSTREALEARIGAVTGIGRNTSEITDPQINNIIEKTLPGAIKTARILAARGDPSELHDIIRNLYGMAESRGQTSNPEAMNATFDLMQRGLASTGGKVTIRDVEAAFRNMKYGSRSLIDDEGVTNVIAYINQLKASGKGGGGSGGQGVTQAGTMITMMTKFAEGGVKNKETINMLQAMGLYEGTSLNDSSTTSTNTSLKGLKHSDELLRDPIGWAMKYFAPAAVKFAKDNPDIYAAGRDLKDPRVMDEAIAAIAIRLFASQGGQNVGQGFAIAALPGPASQIQSENKMTKNAKDTEKSFADLEKTFNQNVKQWEAALKNLELALGQNLLPALTKFLDLASKFVSWMNEVAEANPTATALTTLALAIGAVVLALTGIERVFGIFTILRGWLAGLTVAVGGPAAALTGFAAAWAGAGTTITGVLAVVGLAIRRAIPLFAAFLVGWDIGLLVSSFKVGGKSIGEWFQRFVGWIDQATSRVKYFFGVISKEQLEAELRVKRSILDGDGRTGAGTRDTGIKKIGPAQGKRYSETPEERLRRENEEAAAKLPPMKYTPVDKDANRTFFNPAASAAKNEARVAAAEEAITIKKLDAAYRALEVSVEDYYAKKLGILKSQGAVITNELNKELVALEAPQKGKRDQGAIDRVRADLRIQAIRQEAAEAELMSEKQKDLTALKFKAEDAERQIDAGAGHRHLAEIKRIDEELDKKKQVFELNGMIDAAKAIESTRAARHAAVEYDAVYRGLLAQLDELKIKEQEVTDGVKAGTTTQAEAEQKVWEMRRQSGALIDELIEKLRVLAETSGDEKLVKQVGELARTAKADLTALAPIVLQIKGVVGSSFTTMFNDITSGTKKAKTVFLDFFNSIERGITNIISQHYAEQLMNSIVGSGGGTAGGGGGLLSSLFGGLFSSGGGGGPGIDIIEGGGAILSAAVGLERVPQDMIAKIHKDETVLTAEQAKKYRSGTLEGQGGGSAAVYNTFHVPAPTDTRTQSQIASLAAQSIRNARRNL